MPFALWWDVALALNSTECFTIFIIYLFIIIVILFFCLLHNTYEAAIFNGKFRSYGLKLEACLNFF